jgi:6-phosphogluconolactonase (cycloisomerase 2 family)
LVSRWTLSVLWRRAREYLHNCAVHSIDLIAGTTETVKGSENLHTARVSPDGAYLAALNVESHKLMLYERASHHWRVLAPAITGTDLSWTSDSQTLYVSDLGANAGIVAIRVRDGRRYTAVDMHAIDQLDLATPQDLTFSLSPDNSVLLLHRTSPYEIYMYDLHYRFSF